MQETTGWNDVPTQVLEEILLSLPERDCWSSRRVARSWAAAVRRTAQFDVHIAASRDSVCLKNQAIGRRRVAYPSVGFVLKLETPLHTRECARLLSEVQSLVGLLLRPCRCSATGIYVL